MLAQPLIGSYAAIAVAAAVAFSAVAVAECARPGTASDFSLIATSSPPAPTTPLTPNDRGYVRVVTKSGSTGCSINPELVACQTSTDNWGPDPNGGHFHTASVNADGEFHWVEADLGALAGRVTLDFQAYTAQGWTIVATPEATKFTNDRTGHGMSVSDQSVTPF